MVAIADLGGLGAREGSPVFYNWTAPNIFPALVPWLGLLVLLLLPANRIPSAWLVWLPLILIVATARSVLNGVFDFVPSSVLGWFLEIVCAQTFGIASVWLLAKHLGRRHRFLSFLGILGTLAAFSVLAWGVRQDWRSGGMEPLQMALLLGLCVLAVSVALSLAGLSCRRRYRPVALMLWLVVWLLAVWLVMIIPFFLIAVICDGAGADVLEEMLAGILIVSGVNFATVLPFLILSFASPFYRERLKDLLNLGQEKPPIITAMPAASPA